VRLEIGPRDIEKSQALIVRRDTREKLSAPIDALAGTVQSLLDQIQQNVFQQALRFREEHTTRTNSYDEFKRIMEGRPGFVVAPWCGDAACEAQIKAETQATLRNLPFESTPSGACIRCNGPAKTEAYFAKAY
jgi:prolyl-tRNA synthetase